MAEINLKNGLSFRTQGALWYKLGIDKGHHGLLNAKLRAGYTPEDAIRWYIGNHNPPNASSMLEFIADKSAAAALSAQTPVTPVSEAKASAAVGGALHIFTTEDEHNIYEYFLPENAAREAFIMISSQAVRQYKRPRTPLTP